MRAGLLDRKITIQRVQVDRSPSGDVLETWWDLATRWAEYKPVVGTERAGGVQPGAEQQVEFRVRWDQGLVDVSPLDRVAYPASAATNSPTQIKYIYDIVAVHEMGRQEGLRIVASRKPDVEAT